VHFSRLLLAPGDTVTVADPQRREVHTYSTMAVGGGWAMSVTGDTAVVTIRSRRLTAPLAGLGVAIDRVARGFTAAELRARTRVRKASVVLDDSADAVCYRSSDPVGYNRSKAVTRLLIDGTELCTAWRVGPNNRMFTNHHCLADTGSAQGTEVWFNYECEVCGRAQLAPVTKVWGDQVLATDQVLDYTLVHRAQLRGDTQFGYSSSTSGTRPGARAVHPAAPRRRSPADVELRGHRPEVRGVPARHDVAYYCDTAGGSSGSPVLSDFSNRVVALHHFGGCPNSGVRSTSFYSE